MELSTSKTTTTIDKSVEILMHASLAQRNTHDRLASSDLTLAWHRALMGLKSESRGTRLGYLWWLIEPAMHLIVYYLAFGVLLSHGGDNYVAYLLVGIVHWLWLSKSIMNASSSIQVGRGLILQLPLHVSVFPLAEILRDALKQLVVFLVLLGVLWSLGNSPTWLLLIYPALFLVQLLLTTATACFIASLMPFMPDLRVIIPACLQLGMFLSGVFFTRDIIPAQYQWLLNFNPAYLLLESYRDILIRSQLPNLHALTLLTAVIILLNFAVFSMLSRFNKRYARIIQE
ncbi:ABC-2 type transporter [compost metagenome]